MLFSGCDKTVGPEPSEESSENWRERFNLTTLGEIPYPSDNEPNPARIELGRNLFYDPILSGERDVSCGTCHHANFAFADGRQFGAGVSGEGLGPERTLSRSAVSGEPIEKEPRNSPTILNTAFNGDELGRPSADGVQFFDGRAKGLEEQALLPLQSRAEMRGDAYSADAAVDSVLRRLRAIPEYEKMFVEAFPEEANELTGSSRAQVITRSTYSRAVAAFERELVTRNSPFDRYVQGEDAALTQVQKEGMNLFFDKAQCVVCHNGPMFSDFQFVVHGTPQEGPGKEVIPGDDTGREEHTGKTKDRYAFRTLTLRNVELTGPYMHDGVFESLEEVIEFYNNGARPRHSAITDEMLDPSLRDPLHLTEKEVDALAEFLRSLTDRGSNLPSPLLSVPDSVPSGLTPVVGVGGD